MAQLSLYLEDAAMDVLRESAKAANMSLSKFAARAIARESGERMSNWPAGYWENVYGCMGEDELHGWKDDLDPSLDDACDWFK